MTFLSGQDDFFQTANQPISVRHLSQLYNKLAENISINFKVAGNKIFHATLVHAP